MFGVFSDVPVDPTAPDARQLLVNELSKPEYQAAKPTWLDRASQAVGDWLNSLTLPSNGGLGNLLPVIVAVILVALIVVAFIVFGRPRRARRLGPGAVEALFGSDDRRSSAELRASAASAAAAGDYRTAIEELYRALARRQAERTVVRVNPGTTAQEFAARAGASYPAEAPRLGAAARVFDEVRYLGAPATRADYDDLVALEFAVRDTAPSLREPISAGRA